MESERRDVGFMSKNGEKMNDGGMTYGTRRVMEQENNNNNFKYNHNIESAPNLKSRA